MLNPIEYHHDHQHLLIKPKKCKIDSEQFPVDGDLAAFIGQYALFYYWKDDNNKKSAIPLTTSLAATFRQGRKKELKIDDQFEIHSWADKEFKVATRVVRILEDLDTIVLQSNVKLCNVDHIIDSAIPKKGMRYLLMGFSIYHGLTNHQSFSTGIIASSVRANYRYTGTSGSFNWHIQH